MKSASRHPPVQAYVTNLNAALEKYHKAESSGNVAEMIALQQSIRFNGEHASAIVASQRLRWHSAPACLAAGHSAFHHSS